MKDKRVAIVGIGLRYPDANTPDELWENVLAGRRAFRRLPDDRMNLADYWSPDPNAPDRFYSTKAAVLRGYEFDRVKFRVPGSTYQATDLTHWLALDVAASALADAGFPDAEGLPKRSTAVVIGNSLTGEFSRANIMRLRWPYVRRTTAAALTAKGWDDEEIASFLAELETDYKAPFPPIGEDSLAGGLANTIAGRICNYYDLGGGGFTVDGACSSSLLSVATAANALVDGDADVAIAGGVDLSIDPFEVIGFAKTKALATSEMRVYDRDSNGFWPGEGCGMLVLMREQDALARGAHIYAVIAGWGVSSDGKGGITRPEAGGHRLAIERAYRRAGFGVQTVSYFEGHGTGTALGDATEITALSGARRAADADAAPAALGTIKGNIGHTKAAAGVAGLIKATLAVHNQTIPPGTGQRTPHPLLTEEGAALYVPTQAQLWPEGAPVRAGVSAMGFGGINTHVVVDQAPRRSPRTELSRHTTTLVSGRQDAEVLLFDADDADGMRERLATTALWLAKLSFAELADLAGTLASRLVGGKVRAAVVATDPDDACAKIEKLLAALDEGEHRVIAPREGIALATHERAPRIALLFPGQGAGGGAAGAIRRRFGVAEAVFHTRELPGGDEVATEVAQPAIVAGSLAGLRVLHQLGIEGDVAVGHSLGELTALAWAGAMDGGELLDLATARGALMAKASHGGGAMAGIVAGPDVVSELLTDGVVIAGYNGPNQTVIAGAEFDVDIVCARAAERGVDTSRIRVSHAFHSPLVGPAAEAMENVLAGYDFSAPSRPVVSTVTGARLAEGADLRALLRDQVTRPVRFHEAAAAAVADADLAIEVGPGQILSGLLRHIAPRTPAAAVDTGSQSLVPLLSAVAAAYALGARLDYEALFAGRAIRQLPTEERMTFLTNPCETAPDIAATLLTSTVDTTTESLPDNASNMSTLDLLRQLAAERVELPIDMITSATHPLEDLHLSSITVGQLVNEAVRRLGRPALAATPNFATVRIGELADLIDELAETAGDRHNAAAQAAGVAHWVRAFAVEHVEEPLLSTVDITTTGEWEVFASEGHPLAEPLRAVLAEAGLGGGVLLCLPEDGSDHIALMLEAGKRAVATGTRFVVVHQRYGAAGLARTLHLEAPSVATTVVELTDLSASQLTVARVVAEVAATTGFSEVRYDGDGKRSVPTLRVVHSPSTVESRADGIGLGESDVLLVTGGAKGITAECALAMAKRTGAALALLGRADPTQDSEVATNLERMAAAGVRVEYQRADVTSAEQVAAAVRAFTDRFGPVTAVLHGAGRNEPAQLGNLTETDFTATVAPKVAGLRAVLDAVPAEQIRLLITFGSIIGRAGLPGEAHYSTANGWLTELTEAFGAANPHARALALEWSVWSGAGMGERLGVIESLMREGMTPISVEDGIDVLMRTLADPSAPGVLMVSGRTGGLPTLAMPEPEVPLRRFTDRVLVHYPGVELVTEAELTLGSDPYLGDHLLDGNMLFPAVISMEAMTQVASVLTGSETAPVLERAEFLRPIVVTEGGATTIRIAALHRGDGSVDLAIRSDETSFGTDHFRARLAATRDPLEAMAPPLPLPPVPVDPVGELYGAVMFQGKRFQRLLAYRHVAARRAVAEVSTTPVAPWFAAFLPQELLLADPGARDCAMHAIQCCVPDATLLPQRVDRLHLAGRGGNDNATESGYVLLDARERSQDGDSYTYDVDVYAPSGALLERWEGLTLRAVRKRDGAGPWVPSMLGPYLQRALERVLGSAPVVVVEPVGAGRDRGDREDTALALSRASGAPVTVHYRPDGRPELAVNGGGNGHPMAVSASHGAGLTLAVLGSGPLGCDVETVLPRGEREWADLLGAAQLPVRDLVATETAEPVDVSATRVWAALECLRKVGVTNQTLTLHSAATDRWVLLSTSDSVVATWVTTLNGVREPVVFAFLIGESS